MDKLPDDYIYSVHMLHTLCHLYTTYHLTTKVPIFCATCLYKYQKLGNSWPLIPKPQDAFIYCATCLQTSKATYHLTTNVQTSRCLFTLCHLSTNIKSHVSLDYKRPNLTLCHLSTNFKSHVSLYYKCPNLLVCIYTVLFVYRHQKPRIIWLQMSKSLGVYLHYATCLQTSKATYYFATYTQFL